MVAMADSGDLEVIGGREFTSYCQVLPEHKSIHIQEIKAKEKTVRDRRGFLNDTPSATIEFRFFASSNNPKRVRAYVQFLHSVIEYTRDKKKWVTVEYWNKWVRSHKRKYRELIGLLDVHEPDLVLTGKAVYTKIVYKKYTLDTIPVMKLHKIKRVLLKDGKSFNVFSCSYDHTDNALYIQTPDNRHYCLEEERIKEVYVVRT